jgi:hypothetical protein
MQLQFRWRYAVALFVLTLLCGEAHEQAHIQLGRLVCGCYGERDFSLWATCDACSAPSLAPLASLAGPLFTYAAIWLGAWLVGSRQSPVRQAVGLSLIFAPLPFARIFTVLMGAGDEATFLRTVYGAEIGRSAAVIIAAAVVLLACAPPIVIAWTRLAGRRRWVWVVGLCLIPMLAQGAYVRLVLNRILAAGFLATPVIAGSPALVVVHTAVAALAFAFVAKWLLLIRLRQGAHGTGSGSDRVDRAR